MKEITVTYKTYTFDELSDEAKERAISDEINVILETIPYNAMKGAFKKAVDKAEKMKTPWFTNGYVYDYCKDQIITLLKADNYKFLENGKMFNV